MKNMKSMTKIALLLAVAAAGNSAWAQSVKTPPEGKAYTIRSNVAAVGSGTVTYQWYRNDVAIPNATAVSYTVPANEAYGTNVEFKRRADCNGADEAWSNAVLLSFVPDLSAKITGSTVVCASATELTYSVISVQGATYAWTVPAGWTITAGQGTSIITVTAGAAGGTISVTPTSTTVGYQIAGTARTLAVTVSAAAQPSAIVGSTNVCEGASGLTYRVTNVQGTMYAWTVPAGWSITAGQNTNSITVAAGTTGGTISVTSFRCNGSSTPSTLMVAVGGTPAQPSAIAGIASTCSGQSYTYSVTNISGISYAWTVPNGWTITKGQGTDSVTVTAGTLGGTISVKPSNTCGGSGTARSLSVAVAPAPTQPSAITASATALCPGQTGITYSVSNVAGVTFTWAVPDGWTITDGQDTRSIKVTAGAASGNVSVTPSICGSNGAARVMAVTVGSKPAQPSAITASVGIVCSGQTDITYSVTNAAGVSYAWVVPDGWSITAGQGTNSITVTAGSANGNVSVTPSTCGGNGTAQTLAVTIGSKPAQPSTITTNTTTVCSGQTGVTYTVTDVAGVSYAWTVPTGWSVTDGQGTSSITATAGTADGNVSVTPSACGSSGTARTLAVTVGSAPAQPSAITGDTAACSGQSYTYTVTNVPNVTYTWAVPASWSIAAGQGSNSVMVTAGSSGGSVSITPSNTCGGSGTAQTRAVTVNVAPAKPTINFYDATAGRPLYLYVDTVAACSGQANIHYCESNGVPTPNVTYNWAVPSGWTITAGQGERIITFTVGSNSGNLSVTPYACGNIAGTARTLVIKVSACGVSCGSGNGSLIAGTCWANRNVDDYQTFAAKPDMDTKFYQWNRTTAWPVSSDASLFSGWNTTADYSETWVNAPCPAGWRLPTINEYIALNTSSVPITGTWAITNERGNAVAGRFYGPNHTTCTISDMSGCVFLPAVGYLSNSEHHTLYGHNAAGRYWSGTQINSTFVHTLNFDTENSETNNSTTYKNYAFSVRCVQ